MNRMHSSSLPSLRLAGFYVFLIMLISSCASIPKARYFDGSVPAQYPMVDANLDPVIQKADILNIQVSSLNKEASEIFNPQASVTPTYNATGNAVPTGYLVDTEGDITFPIIGKMKAAGFTKKQLTDSISNTLVQRRLLVDPIVSIRIVNFRVTVLGEVGKPTVVAVNNEKISLLEAIGMAGDLTLSARRDNVLLIREENNKKITRRINLNDESLFRSPYYFLKSGDVVYVEANKAKVQSTSRFTVLLPALLSGLAVLAIIVDRLGR